MEEWKEFESDAISYEYQTLLNCDKYDSLFESDAISYEYQTYVYDEELGD